MAITTVYFWNVFSDPFLLNNLEFSGNQTEPAVAALADGSYFGVWTDPGEVQGRIVGPNGVPAGHEFTVNTPAVNQQFDAHVARLANGNIVVTYTDFSVDPNGDIRARLLTPSGSPIGADVPITTPRQIDRIERRCAIRRQVRGHLDRGLHRPTWRHPGRQGHQL